MLTKSPPAPPATRASRGADWRLVIRDGFSAMFDLVGDWTYLYSVWTRDYDGDGETDSYIYPIKFNDRLIVNILLGFCILSTILSVWTIVTSMGRLCGSRSTVCLKCTVVRLQLVGILCEDLPQLILTAYIDYFTFSGGLTPSGMMNICSSLTALINRMTIKYDEYESEENKEADQYEMMNL
mmetsp:Transcript_34938/g.78748  ORF Transcript_34938/g.78748 Transcript_34938/m.78748 type:complete len:182 (-) Transcript_34938:444-989(-)